ncbi:MAG: helix-turn-helix domain-containing protein [Candidatus Hydrogenedentes bacterium]|nr:helix-turn-helix domain-containing protein [Candidatus Hydrogenedentota bacterium]
MSKKKRAVSAFEQIKSGLEDSIAYSRGELSLPTITMTLPEPPPKTNAKKIAALRRNLRMSQTVFAATLNVSKKTVQSWEQGLRSPSDASLRLLQIIRRRPDVIDTIVSNG